MNILLGIIIGELFVIHMDICEITYTIKHFKEVNSK